MSNRFDRPQGTRSQRQLRAGENVRHILVEVIRSGHLREPSLEGMMVTVGEVRVSPDMKHATAFVSGLSSHTPEQVAEALNKAKKAIRFELGRRLDAKHTPEVRFIPDTSYDDAFEMNRLLAQDRIRADIERREAQTESGASPEGDI